MSMEAAGMKARDVMTSKVVAARPDTPTREIARLLLENHISAVPVVDNSGAPIGMVSEGDLIGRSDSDRQARREWWLAMLAEGEAFSPEFLAGLRRQAQLAGDIMSRPVITVGEDTDTAEIAHLLLAYRIKRVPVLRDGKMVGIVRAACACARRATPAKVGTLGGRVRGARPALRASTPWERAAQRCTVSSG
jgi:CBS domain-containing protein